MTAEIAIMNKEAVALASDSAVTITKEPNPKIFQSANKLFALSKCHPVGIMVYGNASLMGVPWETIIKIYRNKLGKNKFDSLDQYAEDFIQFLDRKNTLFPTSLQHGYLRAAIYAYFNFIKDKIRKKVHSMLDVNDKLSYGEMETIISEIINEDYKIWNSTKTIPSIPKNYNTRILLKHKKIIAVALKEVFEKLPLTKKHSRQLRNIASNLFSKFPDGIEKGGNSGVVVAGFGEKDIFPSLKSFIIEAIVENKLKYKMHESQKINFDMNASIIPFAQSEMVATFMEGVDPFYKRKIEESYSSIFSAYTELILSILKGYTPIETKKLSAKMKDINKENLERYKKELESLRRTRYINPVISVVSILPKDELAAMAESLVNLTSFKRRVTMESETVGGPIDVALISKGDGLIWIKRKHYFKPELNPQFFATHYRGVGYG